MYEKRIQCSDCDLFSELPVVLLFVWFIFKRSLIPLYKPQYVCNKIIRNTMNEQLLRKRININKYRDYCENKHTQNRGELLLSVYFHVCGNTGF